MRICTTNQGKIREFGGLLSPLNITLTPTMGHDIPETGDTFEANALQKALGYAQIYPGEWLLSEDSGLVIPALGGRPGVHSARYTSPDGNEPREVVDPNNNLRVFTEMEKVPKSLRGAYFVSYIVVINPQGEVAFHVGHRTYGWITEKPRGTGGFGYDPLFESPTSFGLTWAELDSARKDLISHRSKATWSLMAWLCSTDQKVM